MKTVIQNPPSTLPTAAPLSPPAGPAIDAPIVALATPAGTGARAILRLSGTNLWPAVRAALGEASLPPAPARRSVEVEVKLPPLHSPLPLRLLAWPAPRSYTGQDVVELHLLSSPPLVEALLAHLQGHGIRAARPGEFTLRAYLAGKVNLAQAEAIHDLVQARTAAEARAAHARMTGGLDVPLSGLREELLVLLAEVEAGLDFADEDLALLSGAELANRVQAARRGVADALAQVSERGRDDVLPRVVLAGMPNAGKSSLFNALLGSVQALVGGEPGTTRDYLCARLCWDNVQCELVDTAGVAEAGEPIGAAAQRLRARETPAADVLLWCQSCEDPSPARVDAPADVTTLAVWTKADLLPLDADLPGQRLRTSAHTGLGLAELRQRLAEALRALPTFGGAPRSSQTRAKLEDCGHRLAAAEQLLRRGDFPELAALELRQALDALGALVGAVYTEDLLDRVFSQFCIGK